MCFPSILVLRLISVYILKKNSSQTFKIIQISIACSLLLTPVLYGISGKSQFVGPILFALLYSMSTSTEVMNDILFSTVGVFLLSFFFLRIRLKKD